MLAAVGGGGGARCHRPSPPRPAVPCTLFLAGMFRWRWRRGGSARPRSATSTCLAGTRLAPRAGAPRIESWSRVAGRAAVVAASLVVAGGAVASVRRLPDWVSDDALFSARCAPTPATRSETSTSGSRRGGPAASTRRGGCWSAGGKGLPARRASRSAGLCTCAGETAPRARGVRRAVGPGAELSRGRLHWRTPSTWRRSCGELAESARALALSPVPGARMSTPSRVEVERDPACEVDLDALERERPALRGRRARGAGGGERSRGGTWPRRRADRKAAGRYPEPRIPSWSAPGHPAVALSA